MKKYQYLQAKFIGLYLLLGAIVVGAYAIGIVAYSKPTPKNVATKADIQAALGETNLVKLACDYTAKAAASQGVLLTSCKKVKVEIKGAAAVVTLHQTSSDGQKFTIAVYLNKSVWTVQTFKVGPG